MRDKGRPRRDGLEAESRTLLPDSQSENTRQRYSVSEIQVDIGTLQQLARRIVSAAAAGEGLVAHLCNTYTVALSKSDHALRDVLQRSQLNVADGAPVAWMGRRHGQGGPVRGPDLVREVVRLGLPFQIRHFFYGGAAGVAQGAVKVLLEANPEMQVASVVTPPFRSAEQLDLADLLEKVALANADIIWVGLGTPKQDFVVDRLATHVSLPIVPIGAAFDFLAGSVKEAPHWLHATGAEWIFRLGTEPNRLWRRYFAVCAPWILRTASMSVWRRVSRRRMRLTSKR